MNLPDKNLGCHLTGFAKKCRKLVADGTCNRWIVVGGDEVGTGKSVEVGDCIDNWTFRLLRENIQAVNQTSADVQGFRNVTVKMIHKLATEGSAALARDLEQVLDLELGRSKPATLENKS